MARVRLRLRCSPEIVKLRVRERDSLHVLAHPRHGRPFHVEGLHPVVGEVGAGLGDAIAVEVVRPACGRSLLPLQWQLEERVRVRSQSVQKRQRHAVVADLEEAPVPARRGQLLLGVRGVQIDAGQRLRSGREGVVHGQWLVDRLPVRELLQRVRAEEPRVLNDALGRERHGGGNGAIWGPKLVELQSPSTCGFFVTALW